MMENEPELARLLLGIRKLDQRGQDFFDDPRALVFVIPEDL